MEDGGWRMGGGGEGGGWGWRRGWRMGVGKNLGCDKGRKHAHSLPN